MLFQAEPRPDWVNKVQFYIITFLTSNSRGNFTLRPNGKPEAAGVIPLPLQEFLTNTVVKGLRGANGRHLDFHEVC